MKHIFPILIFIVLAFYVFIIGLKMYRRNTEKYSNKFNELDEKKKINSLIDYINSIIAANIEVIDEIKIYNFD